VVDLKNPMPRGRLRDVVSGFLTADVLLRSFLLLLGTALILFALRLVIRGDYTRIRGEFVPGWTVAPVRILVGALLVHLGLRKKNFAGKSNDDSNAK
jgi:hypothetical protein